jgi:hypothetical protein
MWEQISEFGAGTMAGGPIGSRLDRRTNHWV